MAKGIFEILGIRQKSKREEESAKERSRTPKERRAAHEMRYENICKSLRSSIPEWKKEIEKKERIEMPYAEFTTKMGPETEKWHPTMIYWDAKRCLLREGILLTSIKKDHEEFAAMVTMKPEYEETIPGPGSQKIRFTKFPTTTK